LTAGVEAFAGSISNAQKPAEASIPQGALPANVLHTQAIRLNHALGGGNLGRELNAEEEAATWIRAGQRKTL
jgi:hypothetical protein